VQIIENVLRRIAESKEENRFIAIDPGQRLLVPTGIILIFLLVILCVFMLVLGCLLSKGLVMANAQGIIDSDYVEESRDYVA
jgi:dUTPase